MQQDDNYQQERVALRKMFPGALPGRIKRLHALAREKRICIIATETKSPNLNYIDRLMVSIVRHESTQYDAAMKSGMCSKESARGIIAPIIRSEMKKMKGD